VKVKEKEKNQKAGKYHESKNPDNIVNLRVIFNMEENIQEVKQTKLYVNAS
jgi:hypothetical protein